MSTLPNRIKDLREEVGLSQEALGERVGTSGQQIARLEKEERRLTLQWMRRVAKGLGVAPIDLLLPSDREAESAEDLGKFVKDREQLALLRFWEDLLPSVRLLILSRIRDEAGLLAESTDRNDVADVHRKPRKRGRR